MDVSTSISGLKLDAFRTFSKLHKGPFFFSFLFRLFYENVMKMKMDGKNLCEIAPKLA